MGDPVTKLNLMSGRHRIELRNGDPVLDESPAYEILSMLYEDPGWPMEETPREGNLKREFEETGQDTASQFKAAVERRCEPIINDRKITSAECTAVQQVIRTDGSAIFFNLLYESPGEPAREAPIEIGS